jgi:hypothetical protein
MPQSLAAVQLHIVFSTKNRAPLITPELAPKLCGYIHGIIAAGPGVLLAAGGVRPSVSVISRGPVRRTPKAESTASLAIGRLPGFVAPMLNVSVRGADAA